MKLFLVKNADFSSVQSTQSQSNEGGYKCVGMKVTFHKLSYFLIKFNYLLIPMVDLHATTNIFEAIKNSLTMLANLQIFVCLFDGLYHRSNQHVVIAESSL